MEIRRSAAHTEWKSLVSRVFTAPGSPCAIPLLLLLPFPSTQPLGYNQGLDGILAMQRATQTCPRFSKKKTLVSGRVKNLSPLLL